MRGPVHQVIIGFVLQRNEGAGHVLHMDAGTVMHGFLFALAQIAARVIVDAPGPAVLVIDRHPGMRAQRMIGARRNDGVPGHDPGRDAPVVAVFLGLATCAHQQPAAVFGDIEFHFQVALVVFVALGADKQRIGIECTGMQEGDMRGIDAAFHRLQVIDFLEALGHIALRRTHMGPFDGRWCRLQFRRAHVGPDDVTQFDARIALELDATGHAAVGRLGGNLDALAAAIKFPAVIRAAQSVFFIATKPQRHTAMGAKLVDEIDLAAAVAKGDQLLGQQLDPHRRTVRLGQFPGMQRRYPVAPEQISHQAAGSGLGQFLVLFFGHHGV